LTRIAFQGPGGGLSRPRRRAAPKSVEDGPAERDRLTEVHRWSVGDVDIVRVEDLDFAVPSDRPVPDWCVPNFAPSADEVGIAFSALALRSDGVRIVVDPWLANDGPRDQAGAQEHSERLLGELSDAGFPPDDVDIVVNTHLDGLGWNTRPAVDRWVPAFPNARYVYPTDELAAIRRGEPLYGREAFAILDDYVEIEPIDGPMALTTSVTLAPAPGHNFGHLAVRVESNDRLAIYPGHLVLSPFQIDDPDSGEDHNPERTTAIATRRAVLEELAQRSGLLVTTLLGGPGGGVVQPKDSGFSLSVLD